MDKIKNFKELKIWQKGVDIVEEVYRITEGFPQKEIYGITAQMRRAVISIPSNIAEGFKRYHNKEFIQFLYISQSSAAELETQLIIAYRLKYLGQKDLNKLTKELEALCKMNSVLIKKLR